jgi:hypothetical protein
MTELVESGRGTSAMKTFMLPLIVALKMADAFPVSHQRDMELIDR